LTDGVPCLPAVYAGGGFAFAAEKVFENGLVDLVVSATLFGLFVALVAGRRIMMGLAMCCRSA
jgi:hypothetical protein